MKQEQTRVPSLRELELAAEAEARVFARVRLQKRLQEIVDQRGEVFAHSRHRAVQAALTGAPPEHEPERASTPLTVLMLNGWQVRQRSPGLGKEKTSQPRGAWHEWKTDVHHRHEQSGVTAGRRGGFSEKVVTGWQGDPVELGRRLHWKLGLTLHGVDEAVTVR